MALPLHEGCPNLVRVEAVSLRGVPALGWRFDPGDRLMDGTEYLSYSSVDFKGAVWNNGMQACVKVD